MRSPSKPELEALADDLGIVIGDGELETYARVVADRLAPLERIEELATPQRPPREYDHARRGPGYQPDEDEDPHNAWITKCRVDGAEDGQLGGFSIGLKDSISVAGIPLTNGSRVLEGYVPTVDATVVSRVLDAGGTIAGKNNMWSFSIGASDYGPVRNPTAPEHSIGGSSSGTATAVAAGEIDIGIGGDQGGSIRIPSSFGGLVGLKPTHGLVPYTGVFGADPSIDHVGPITRTVGEAAIALSAMAGRDGLDPRQPHDLDVQAYTDAAEAEVSEMTVAVLREGFEHEASDHEVIETVRDAVADLEALGAEVTEVSVPEHAVAVDVTLSIIRYGYGQVLQQNGVLSGFSGWYDTGAVRYLSRALAARSSDLPAAAKVSWLASEFVRRNYGGSVYGKAQNLAATVREAYDEALADVDALVLPTVPITPPPSGGETGLEAMLGEGSRSAIGYNTAPFNASHHPALTVPCGDVGGAPVGMMLVGKRFDEAALFRLAGAYERTEPFR
ncbi:amidase [Halobellus salinisoli]|uniref:amidase n=1 Tax=Halobellus salinisoli TaxID=3108500 RepID=UPI003008D578